jgi:hypothetical protein
VVELMDLVEPVKGGLELWGFEKILRLRSRRVIVNVNEA